MISNFNNLIVSAHFIETCLKYFLEKYTLFLKTKKTKQNSNYNEICGLFEIKI